MEKPEPAAQPAAPPPQPPTPPPPPQPQRGPRAGALSSLDTEDWLILAVLVLSLWEEESEPGVALIAAALYLFLQ